MTAPAGYQVVWSPLPGNLFTLPETAGAIHYDIAAEVIPPPTPPTPPGGGAGGAGGAPPVPVPDIVGYRAELLPSQSLMSIHAKGSGITVSAPTLAGLFPLDDLVYRQHDAIRHIHDWAHLPDDVDVIAMKASTSAEKAYTLTAYVDLSDDTSATAVYELTIQQEWSAGRDILRRVINARRNQKG